MQNARPRIRLGDINDLDAYVRTIVRAVDPSEDEDLVASGYELAFAKFQELRPRESLQAALSGWLELRLRDVRRKNHPEWRRNTRAGMSYSHPVPTGLSWEHDSTTPSLPAGNGDWRISESRMNLQMFSHESDFYNSQVVGRFLGVPSAAVIATQKAREIYATLAEERAFTASSGLALATATAPAA